MRGEAEADAAADDDRHEGENVTHANSPFLLRFGRYRRQGFVGRA
jgi:hypothetical protein